DYFCQSYDSSLSVLF
nr:immunoglobulin light chain junction region [Macaca mulatta]MOW68270.1 immunoglobulin light chain junction region [Macaca mulatta]